MRLVVLSFIFCFSLSLSVPNLLSARPTSTETKEESALLALISKRKHVLKKKIPEKKTKTSLFLFFFFFFLRVSVKGKKKSAGFFLSLSLITSNHARYLPCSHFRACVKKSRKGNCIWETRARGRFSLFLSFRFGALGQARLKKTKKKLSLSICFFLSLTSLPQSITLF